MTIHDAAGDNNTNSERPHRPEPAGAAPAADPFEVVQDTPLPADGLIDMHCHLLPGIDDGCDHMTESIACIRRLKESGFVASICTPHVWPLDLPENTAENIERWLLALRHALAEEGVDYHLYAGAEVRLGTPMIDHFQRHEIPTLADSNCVLTDFWTGSWHGWVDECMHFLIERGYQPILAHPERQSAIPDFELHLQRLEEMGVWLQGNVRCITGRDGAHAQENFTRWLDQGRYRFLALDLHRPRDTDHRLEGLDQTRAHAGEDVILKLMSHAPRTLIGAQSN